jgi:hypothetical protein
MNSEPSMDQDQEPGAPVAHELEAEASALKAEAASVGK